ncbi:hypothetical protein ACVWW2_004215 [Bradyrhizobium sp. LM4.3]
MAPRHDRAGVTRALANVSHAFSILIAAIAFALPGTATAGEVPTFAVDSSWPKPLPNNWILGQVGGITVDWQGHIWVIHRPRSLTDDEKGASLNPPRSKCCVSAPPVLEFDTDGNLLRSWGGAGEGYEWVGREHGIEVDERGFVWVGGNADNDNAILKFTLDGKFVAQIGKIAPSLGSNDTTQLGKPAETAIDKEANEIYVADGYGNRRVIVFDATTLAYKRHWGAYGNKPDDTKQAAYDPKAPVSQQFGNPVHCVKLANDGLVYVCDRINNRIQVFKKDGTFVKEFFFAKRTRSATAPCGTSRSGPIRSRPGCSAPTAKTTRSGSSGARTAAWSAALGTTAAMPDNSTGCMPWQSTPRVTSIPPRSTPESASRNSS